MCGACGGGETSTDFVTSVMTSKLSKFILRSRRRNRRTPAAGEVSEQAHVLHHPSFGTKHSRTQLRVHTGAQSAPCGCVKPIARCVDTSSGSTRGVDMLLICCTHNKQHGIAQTHGELCFRQQQQQQQPSTTIYHEQHT